MSGSSTNCSDQICRLKASSVLDLKDTHNPSDPEETDEPSVLEDQDRQQKEDVAAQVERPQIFSVHRHTHHSMIMAQVRHLNSRGIFPSIIFEEPEGPIEFKEQTDEAYKIELLQWNGEVVVEVEGRNTVHITVESDCVAYEVVVPKDVDLKATTAAVHDGTLTIMVPKKQDFTLFRRNLKKTRISVA